MIDPIGLQAVKDEKWQVICVASVTQLRKCVMRNEIYDIQVITPDVGIRDFQISWTALKGTR